MYVYVYVVGIQKRNRPAILRLLQNWNLTVDNIRSSVHIGRPNRTNWWRHY